MCLCVFLLYHLTEVNAARQAVVFSKKGKKESKIYVKGIFKKYVPPGSRLISEHEFCLECLGEGECEYDLLPIKLLHCRLPFSRDKPLHPH